MERISPRKCLSFFRLLLDLNYWLKSGTVISSTMRSSFSALFISCLFLVISLCSFRGTLSILLDRKGNDLVPDVQHDREGKAFVLTSTGERWVRLEVPLERPGQDEQSKEQIIQYCIFQACMC